jgi:hypothetical protein
MFFQRVSINHYIESYKHPYLANEITKFQCLSLIKSAHFPLFTEKENAWKHSSTYKWICGICQGYNFYPNLSRKISSTTPIGYSNVFSTVPLTASIPTYAMVTPIAMGHRLGYTPSGSCHESSLVSSWLLLSILGCNGATPCDKWWQPPFTLQQPEDGSKTCRVNQ